MKCRHRNRWGLTGESSSGDAELYENGARKRHAVCWCADCGAVATSDGSIRGRLKWIKPKAARGVGK